jgi:hypothetical protein
MSPDAKAMGVDEPQCATTVWILLHPRPAKVGDKLISAQFSESITRGFTAVGEAGVAVCLLSGTELAFDKKVEYEPRFHLFQDDSGESIIAQFRWVNLNQPRTHHDALEFPDGQIILLTRLLPGQVATVLQLPTSPAKHTHLEQESNTVI